MNDVCETTIRVRYKDTDQLGIVYHGNYLTFFEVGRVEYLRERGLTYKDMEQQDDSHIVVVESHCRYLRPARYDDVLRIRTRVLRARRRTLHFAYEVINDATGELLATGETLHVVCNKAGRPKALPEKYWKLFESLEDDNEETGKGRRGKGRSAVHSNEA